MITSLYILQHGDAKWDLFKIGVAANVPARIAHLQTGNPFELRQVRKIDFPTRSDAFSTERALHSMLELWCYGARGEWFGGPLENIEEALRLVLMDTKFDGAA